jgi:arylsulfatase A-like enzyme
VAVYTLSSCTDTRPHPNIVLILADDMGWGDVNANNNESVHTPVLNRLKSESLSFDRFYVCPLSAPTRLKCLPEGISCGQVFLR